MMVQKRDLERTINILQRQVDKLRSWGLPAAAIYNNRQGGLNMYGSPAITQVVRDHKEDILSLKDYREVFRDTDKAFLLPIIDPPLEQRNYESTREMANNVVRASCSPFRVGWGAPEKKPVWWPVDIAWTKRGLQSGVNHKELKRIVYACYAHHGQDMKQTQDGNGTHAQLDVENINVGNKLSVHINHDIYPDLEPVELPVPLLKPILAESVGPLQPAPHAEPIPIPAESVGLPHPAPHTEVSHILAESVVLHHPAPHTVSRQILTGSVGSPQPAPHSELCPILGKSVVLHQPAPHTVPRRSLPEPVVLLKPVPHTEPRPICAETGRSPQPVLCTEPRLIFRQSMVLLEPAVHTEPWPILAEPVVVPQPAPHTLPRPILPESEVLSQPALHTQSRLSVAEHLVPPQHAPHQPRQPKRLRKTPSPVARLLVHKRLRKAPTKYTPSW